MPALRIRRDCAVATVCAMGIGVSNAGMIAIGVLGAWTGPAQAAGPVVFSPPDDRDTRAVAIQLDNDLFSGSARDRDYSWGLSATFAQSLKTDAFGDARVAATQYGLIAMTPANIVSSDPDTTDRPYASLLYVTRGWLDVEGSRAVYNGVTVGLLGLGLAESLQSELHAAIGGDDPRGWHHQISNGGELTARWLRSDQWLLNPAAPWALGRPEFKIALSTSVGYLTEGAAAVTLRWGRVETPWWSHHPELSDYTAAPITSMGSGDRQAHDTYLFAGARIKARAYNTFLQGQFRSSDVRIDGDDIARLQGEAWGGIAMTWSTLRMTYTLRVATKEVNHGPAARTLMWGAIAVEKSF